MPNHTVSTNVDTMLRAADNAAIRTAIGVGTTDSPTFGQFITLSDATNFTYLNFGGSNQIQRENALMWFSSAGSRELGFTIDGPMRLRQGGGISWWNDIRSGTLKASIFSSVDNIIEQRNGATAQAFRVYNTFPGTGNNEWGGFDWQTTANTLRIGTAVSGTGVGRGVTLAASGAGTAKIFGGPSATFSVQLMSGGGGTSLLDVSAGTSEIFSNANLKFAPDNAYDIGASGANRPRNIFAGNGLIAAGNYNTTRDASIIFAASATDPLVGTNLTLRSSPNVVNALCIGGTTSAFPAIKRNGAGIDIRLADDSAYTRLIAGSLGLGTANPVADLDIADTWNAPAITVTGASGNGTTATITFATQATAIQVGAKIVVASVNPTGYNGTFVVTASTVTSMSYANVTTTAWVSGGTVQRQFDSVKINATDTASDPNSNLIDLQVNAISKARITKYGTFIGPESGVSKSPVVAFPLAGSYAVGIWSPAPYTIQFAMSAANGLNDTTSYNGMQYEMTTATLSWGASISQDIKLSRDAAGILAQRNGTNAQAFRLYNTTDAGLTNFERVNLEWSGGLAILQTVKGGTGTDRSLVLRSASELFFGVAGGSQWKIDGNAHFLAVTDNQRDIGASNANRPRSIYAGTSVECGTVSYIGWTGRAKIYSPSGSNNVIQLLNNAANDFNLLLLGLANSAFPAIKRNGAGIQIRLADDSANAALESGNFTSTGTIKPERATLTTSATSVTLDISHAGTVLIVTNASPITVTLPTASSVGVGYNVMVIQGGAGAITFAAGAGNTLNSFGTLVTSAGQHAAAGIVCTASNIYNLSGNLT